MKQKWITKILALAISFIILCGTALPVFAEEGGTETPPTGETEISDESGTALPPSNKEKTEGEEPEGEKPGDPGIPLGPVLGDDVKDTAPAEGSGDSNPEKPEYPLGPSLGSDEVTIIPSDANALVLMDTGAQSPRGVPGNIVDVVLPIAVNREFLPSSKYVLRNITISPDIPSDKSVESWPFDLINASYTRHLKDMSYNSTAEVWYKFRISEFATKGVYPVNFTVSATVWREDPVNGTSITEDVEFDLGVWVTVTDDGSASGVISNYGPLQLAGRSGDAIIESPTGSPKDKVKMVLPVTNKGGELEDVTIAPVVSASVDDFPFIAENINYGQNFSRWSSGKTRELTYEFTISPFATSGNKVVKFHATYTENGVTGECDFYAYVYITNGYEDVQNTAPSVMVKGYKILVNGQETQCIQAGESATLRLEIVNNAKYDTVYKVVSALAFGDTKSVVIAMGGTDSGYVSSIGPGKTATVDYQILARTDAPVGPAVVGVTLNYETWDVVQGQYKQNLMLPVQQPMNVLIDAPVIYGTVTQGKEFSAALNIVNMGRAKACNITILAMDGVSMAESYYGGDLAPAGTMEADILLVANKEGNYNGTLLVSYEDGNGQQYTQAVTLPVSVGVEPEETIVVQAAPTSTRSSGYFLGMPWYFWLILVILLIIIILIILIKLGIISADMFRKEDSEESEAEAGNDITEGESNADN